ncbi:SRPBCC domain-containing protein [Paraglaciecola aquimarina]|uniref:SRPBCC domain-containing protein n=1 Tax=Paraglaciecola algarum TaxID=3050085 RepID=A0ABS9D198_9ALTE|nr:SRPBCC domain-containing protein [Paraglaciecola sp. G1-23]MCF2946696.1 SRPBCC domain-containing protein [Paraglaciecola sp. G1-23]
MNVTKHYIVPFPLKTVYAAWVSSNTVISPATRMDILPEVGGHYRLIMKSPEYTSSNEGRFLIAEPESHLRYTWEWNKDGEITEIDVRFTSIPEGTEIQLQHSGFKKQQSADIHASGWDSYIIGFCTFLEGAE